MKSFLSNEKCFDEIFRFQRAMQPSPGEKLRKRFESILSLVESWDKFSEDERLSLDSIAGTCDFYPGVQTIPLAKIINSILQQPEERQQLFFAGADYLVNVHAEIPDLVECFGQPTNQDHQASNSTESKKRCGIKIVIGHDPVLGDEVLIECRQPVDSADTCPNHHGALQHSSYPIMPEDIKLLPLCEVSWPDTTLDLAGDYVVVKMECGRPVVGMSQGLFMACDHHLKAIMTNLPSVQYHEKMRDKAGRKAAKKQNLKCSRAVVSGEDTSKIVPCGKKAPYLSPLGHPSCLEHKDQAGGIGNFQRH